MSACWKWGLHVVHYISYCQPFVPLSSTYLLVEGQPGICFSRIAKKKTNNNHACWKWKGRLYSRLLQETIAIVEREIQLNSTERKGRRIFKYWHELSKKYWKTLGEGWSMQLGPPVLGSHPPTETERWSPVFSWWLHFQGMPLRSSLKTFLVVELIRGWKNCITKGQRSNLQFQVF